MYIPKLVKNAEIRIKRLTIQYKENRWDFCLFLLLLILSFSAYSSSLSISSSMILLFNRIALYRIALIGHPLPNPLFYFITHFSITLLHLSFSSIFYQNILERR